MGIGGEDDYFRSVTRSLVNRARNAPTAADGSVSTYDVHATILHLLGIDHERLTVRHDGADRRLTDVHGRVIDDILA